MFCHHFVAVNASCSYYHLVVLECLELALSNFIVKKGIKLIQFFVMAWTVVRTIVFHGGLSLD